MDADFTTYLSMMNDEQLGLFWIIGSERAKKWIQEELVRRAVARGEIPVNNSIRTAANGGREVVAA